MNGIQSIFGSWILLEDNKKPETFCFEDVDHIQLPYQHFVVDST